MGHAEHMLKYCNIGSEVEITSCSRDKGKNVFQMECFYDRLHFNPQITNVFMGLDLEADMPRMNPELGDG